jgi:hypothetical protein
VGDGDGESTEDAFRTGGLAVMMDQALTFVLIMIIILVARASFLKGK